MQKRLRNLGFNIRNERVRKGFTQEYLAEILNISRGTVSLMETGKTDFAVLKLISISEVLGVGIEILTRNI